MVIARAILKARLAATVETRNMFEIQYALATSLDADIQSSIEAWVTSIVTAFSGTITTLWVPYSLQIQEYITGAWNDVVEVPFTSVGLASGDFSSFQTAVLFVARTGGLKVMGKKFFAGLIEAATTSGSITGGAVALFAAGLAAYITPVVSTAGKLGTPGVVDKHGTFWAFIGGSVGSILSTMRRRKPGYGI